VLSGAKTYIVAGLMLACSFAKSRGWIDESTYATVMGILGAGGLAALRAGVAAGKQ
jgi:hypothetical protein